MTAAGRRIFSRAPLLLPVALMATKVWPGIWKPGYLPAWDAAGHLLRANYWAKAILPTGHLFGWFPLWYGGFNLYQVYPPLLYYILGPLSLFIEKQLALRLVCAGLWIGLVPAAYFFLRGLGGDRRDAAVGSWFIFFLNAGSSVGYDAIYWLGLLPNALGFLLAMILAGSFYRNLASAAPRMRRLAWTGVAGALLVLAHPFCALAGMFITAAIVSSFLIFPEENSRIEIVKRSSIVLALMLGLSAYYWVGFLAGTSNMLHTEAFFPAAREEIAAHLLSMLGNGGWILDGLALAGLVYLHIKNRRRLALFFIFNIALFFLLSTDIFFPFRSLAGSTQRVRFEGFYYFFVLMLAAQGVPALWDMARLARWALLVLLGIFVFKTADSYDRVSATPISNAATARLPGIAAAINARIKPGESILTDDNRSETQRFGSPHFLENLSLQTNFSWDMNGGLREGTLASAQVGSLSRVFSGQASDDLREEFDRRGIHFVVSMGETSTRSLENVPWLMWIAVDGSEELGLFEVLNYKSTFGLRPELAALLEKFSYAPPGRYQLKFKKPLSLPEGTTFAVSYHPWLIFKAGNVRIPVDMDKNHQLRLRQATPVSAEFEISYNASGFISHL